MFRAIASFELRYHLRAPLFWILFILYFVGAFVSVTIDAGSFGAIGNVKANAPIVVMQCLLLMSVFATLTTSAFIVNAAHRDFELNTDALFFSTPVTKWQYLTGRFAGSFLTGFLVYCGVVLACVLGNFAPWVAKDTLGPFTLTPYLFSLGVMVLPNLLVIAAIAFSVAALTRSLMGTYATLIAMALLYTIALSVTEERDWELLGAMIDPFGINASFVAFRYWTVFEKNTQVLPLEGVFLWNRLLWLGISATLLTIAYLAFNFTTRKRRSSERSAERRLPAGRSAGFQPAALPLVSTSPRPLIQFATLVRLETVTTLKSFPFLIIFLTGIVTIAAVALDASGVGYTYPVTREMIDGIRFGFSMFALLIAAFYAGDVVWRERTLKLHEVTDAMPVATSVQWSAKLTSLLIIVLSTLLAAILTSLAVQTVRGYTDYELLLYVKGALGLVGVRMVLLTGLAFAMQVFFNHKLAALIGVTIWFVANLALPQLGMQHVLYRYASTPQVVYSDMNGYGHFAAPAIWSNVYWLFFLALLLAVGHLFWIRGTETTLRLRWQLARQRFGRAAAATLVILMAGFTATGCYIYYNTNVLNPYRTADDFDRLAATMEKTYKKYEELPQPRIVAVQANVDIHPERRAVHIRGSYVATNKSGAPIRELLVNWNVQRLTRLDTVIPGARLKRDDRVHGYRMYALEPPLAPGASMTVTFHAAYEANGFPNGNSNVKVVENGTFIHNLEFFPHFGYNPRHELQDDREEHGLPPHQRRKKPDDMQARQQNAHRVDWISLDTTVSTSADQIALAPGYLQREWTANGRRYFHYKTTAPILEFFGYLSARYAVKRELWNGIPIEVYYHPPHHYNVDRMIRSVKKSLDYYTAQFSPYQHRQVRILEFPRYAGYAQALPNTIPYSESIGFITDLSDPEALDYVFYITAHEIAHQWWGHQVVPGNVQGSTLLSETMSQYSALMVMEKEYGPAMVQRFLRQELDRYLSLRSNEHIGEMPLLYVDRQEYVHYNKGSLALYALRDYLGEERLNRALAKFIRDYAFAGPPYPASTDLLRYIRAEALPEHQQLITDLFERITLYDLETREATVTRRADGKYTVKLTVASKKLRADDQGEEQQVPLDDWIDIGVFGADRSNLLGKALSVQKRRLTKSEETFEIVVSERPARAGIDPYNKLIDRNPKDNTKSL